VTNHDRPTRCPDRGGQLINEARKEQPRMRAHPAARTRSERDIDQARANAVRRDRRDPATYSPSRASTPTANTDPHKRFGPREYFERLAGIVVPRDGLVNCPAHEDRIPSCSVGTDASQGWRCHAGGCGARGAIYDLASVLLGGPWGPQLGAKAFKRARAYVVDAFGEPIGDHDGTASGRPWGRSTR
jgi:hypothetical protein